MNLFDTQFHMPIGMLGMLKKIYELHKLICNINPSPFAFLFLSQAAHPKVTGDCASSSLDPDTLQMMPFFDGHTQQPNVIHKL